MIDKEKFAKEEELGYTLFISAKNFQLTEPMRQHILEKLSKIERFHSHIMTFHVTLEIEKVEHVCRMYAHFNHFDVRVEERSTDMYASIDRAIQKMQQLFRKWKGRMQDYSKEPLKTVDMIVNVYRRPSREDEVEEINREIEAEMIKEWKTGKVIARETRILKTLKIDDAIMKMELSGDNFMLFRDPDQKLKLIYRRPDGNYGIIQAET